MSGTAKLGLTAASLVLLNLFVATLDSSKASAAPNDPSKPVYITNTPLPVAGTLAIGSLPSVTISNTPLPVSGTVAVSGGTVGISGPVQLSSSTPLAVSNALDSSSNPIPLVVAAPALVPYQSSCTIGLTLTCSFQGVPTGKRLVVQEFDIQVQVNGGTLNSVQLTTSLGGSPSTHVFPVNNNGNNFYVTHQPTTLYADQSTTPFCGIDTNGSISGPTPVCNVSGYLVNTQ